LNFIVTNASSPSSSGAPSAYTLPAAVEREVDEEVVHGSRVVEGGPGESAGGVVLADDEVEAPGAVRRGPSEVDAARGVDPDPGPRSSRPRENERSQTRLPAPLSFAANIAFTALSTIPAR
jgi:hypothetical protein